MNLHSLVQFPAELHSPFAAGSRTVENRGNSAQLLELRSESGTLYVRPSKWQSLRLRWIFRHFQVLPQQVLSRRDQRLIEKLSRSAPVMPPPSGENTVLGVVETPRTRSTTSAHPVVTMRPRSWQPSASGPNPQRIFSERPDPGYGKVAASPRGSRRISDAPFRQWGALSVLTALCILVILAKLYFAPPEKTVLGKKLATPTLSVAQTVTRTTPPTAAVPVVRSAMRTMPPAIPVELPKHPPAPLLSAPKSVARNLAPAASPVPSPVKASTSAVLPTELAAITPPAPKDRVFVSELPPGHFAAPVVSDPNQVGELHLKALIAADGSVKDVTLVSGDPKLAKAGIRAVLRWHYNPYQDSSTQGERETLINMKFFGQDAVSVTSAAR
jgi:Gram-negative bacterial TonB protein C-terminal